MELLATYSEAAPAAEGEAAPAAEGEAAPAAEGEAAPAAEGEAAPPAEGEAAPPAEGEAPAAPAYVLPNVVNCTYLPLDLSMSWGRYASLFWSNVPSKYSSC